MLELARLTRNMWQSRLIWVSAVEEHVIHAPHQVEDLNTHDMDRKWDRAESNQSKLGNMSVTWIKHEAKSKATRGNLMNLLDLAKYNRADS
jgi:hypothetical protein